VNILPGHDAALEFAATELDRQLAGGR
jgi:hypothetical protein